MVNELQLSHKLDELDAEEVDCQRSLMTIDVFDDFDDNFNRDFLPEIKGEYTPVDQHSEPIAPDQVDDDDDWGDDDEDDDDDWGDDDEDDDDYDDDDYWGDDEDEEDDL